MKDFKSELFNRITNKDIFHSKSLAKTVKNILMAADEEFWEVPSSNSGRFHPAEDQGKEGLIRHIIKASYVFEEISRRERFEDYEHDAGMAAVILHDIKKNGNPWGKSTDYRHGIIGAEFIKKFYFSDNTIKKMVMNGVRYHMAPWNTTILPSKLIMARKNPSSKIFSLIELNTELEERTRGLYPSKVEKAVQESDYWASREIMSFYPGITVMPDINKKPNLRMHDTPERWVQEILEFNGMINHYRSLK